MIYFYLMQVKLVTIIVIYLSTFKSILFKFQEILLFVPWFYVYNISFAIQDLIYNISKYAF